MLATKPETSIKELQRIHRPREIDTFVQRAIQRGRLAPQLPKFT
jgi:hypothetical protein